RQLRPGSREDLLVVRGVVRDEEPGVQDFSQSSSSRDSSRIFSIRSTVVIFDRKPPRSSRRGTGRRTIESPRSSTTSRLPSSIRCRLRNSIGIVVWPLRVTLMTYRARALVKSATQLQDVFPEVTLEMTADLIESIWSLRNAGEAALIRRRG